LKHYQILHTAFIAATSITLIFFSSITNAAIVSHSVDFNVDSISRGDNPTSSFTAAIPFFDSTIGTLRQVDLRYNFDLEFGISISNRTLNPIPYTLAANTFRVEGPRFFDRFNFNNLVASQAILQTLIDVPAGTQRTIGSITLILPGRASYISDIESTFFRTSKPLTIRNIVLRPQGDVAPFIGSGDKVLEFLASVGNPLNLPNSGSILSGVSSSSNINVLGSVDVTYEYTAAVIPIPATLPLFLSGILGIGLVARQLK
jgi:hypothetical protein